jgi:hypothetical protein
MTLDAKTCSRSRVEGDKRTEDIEPRSYFPDASVDQTEARRGRAPTRIKFSCPEVHGM